MIPTIQLKISINIGRINHIIFSPPCLLEAFLSSFLMMYFTLLLVTPLVCDTCSKLNHWDSYQLTTKNDNRKRLDKTSIVDTGLVISK